MSYIKTFNKIILLLIFIPTLAYSIERPEKELSGVGLSTVLGNNVDLNLEFTDSEGQKRSLQSFFIAGKPIILVPAYYHCPKLCGLVLKGVAVLLSKLTLDLNRDFRVVTVSFDTDETAKNAGIQEQRYRKDLQLQSGDAQGWHFLVGEESSVKPLMDALGFNYKKDGNNFAHSAAIFVLTADGRIAQYFSGIDFSAWNVRLALVDASMGAIGSAVDHILLFCFSYDPLKGRYTWAVQNMMRAGGVLTLIFIVGLILRLRRQDKLRNA